MDNLDKPIHKYEVFKDGRSIGFIICVSGWIEKLPLRLWSEDFVLEV